ncbi:hypothetical protein C6H65_20340 [Photorhabdus luminescens]|nr:hypothetical protein C6H65_20340 [Photorhabdus luminescens]
MAWGKYNVNTKVGNGLNVAVMKGQGNANIHVGDGLGINACYARNNAVVKIGNGDFYSFSATENGKLSSLFEHIKQTTLGVGAVRRSITWFTGRKLTRLAPIKAEARLM